MSKQSYEERWGSDVPVSRPAVAPADLQHTVVIDLGGMIFGPMGLMLPTTEALVEERYTPPWRPHGDPVSGRDDDHG